MSRKLVLAAALFAATASAQQSVDINAADFSSGKGDAALAALAKQAAAEGKRVVVTAPKEWHKSIASKLGKGQADVVLREGFYESLLARVEDKPEPAKSAKAALEKAPSRSAPAVAPAPVKAPETMPAAVAVAGRPIATAAAVPVAAATSSPSASASPAARPAAAARAAEPATDVEAIRERMRQSLIEGRPAQGSLAVAALQSGDVIYVDGPVRGVVRRESLKAVLYWLDGDLDLRRSELNPSAANRYQVQSPIRGEGTLRREFDTSTAELVASVPADDAPARNELEKKFNAGRRIVDRLGADRLQEGDVVYAGAGAAVVVRRDGRDMRRYWLDGSLDTRQSGVQAEGPGKYRIRGSVAR